jgi:purine nucleoside phosphorylase
MDFTLKENIFITSTYNSSLTEARLAREAEISYATLAMATDYDCFGAHQEEHTRVEEARCVACIKRGLICNG